MGITNYDHEGYSSGGHEGVSVASGIITSTTPFANGEPFYNRLAWKDNIESNPIPDDNWIVFGFILRVTDSLPTAQREILEIRDFTTAVRDFSFRLETDGEFNLAGVFPIIAEVQLDQEYLIECKYKRADPGDIRVWADETLMVETSGDLTGGVNDVYLVIRNDETAAPGSMMLEVNSFYMRSDDGADIGTINSRHGPYDILGSYQGGPASVTPNFGTALDGGQWINAANLPSSDGTVATYGLPVSTTKSGLVTFDDVRPGPFGDAAADGTPITIKHIWRAKKAGPANIVLSGLYGSIDPDAAGYPDVDGTVPVSFGNITTAFVNYVHVIDAAADIYDRELQMGFEGVRNPAGSGTKNLDVSLMTASILQRSPRIVMVGGKALRYRV